MAENATDHQPIPGERDPHTLTRAEPHAIGGGGFGAHLPHADRELSMDAETIHDREIEGGGGERKRGRK